MIGIERKNSTTNDGEHPFSTLSCAAGKYSNDDGLPRRGAQILLN